MDMDTSPGKPHDTSNTTRPLFATRVVKRELIPKQTTTELVECSGEAEFGTHYLTLSMTYPTPSTRLRRRIRESQRSRALHPAHLAVGTLRGCRHMSDGAQSGKQRRS